MSLKNGMTKAVADKAIKAVSDKLEKRFDGAKIIKMSDSADTSIECRSTGRPDLDTILGGGWAVGKIVEVYSEEACGKTGLILEGVKVVQDLGGVVGYIDSEHALNNEYCEKIGVNIDDLYLSQPETAEEAFSTIRLLISTGAVDLIVVDSVAALLPKSVLEGETGEAKIGALARIMSQGLCQIKAEANSMGCTILFINQLRDTLNQYGSSKKPAGGNSLKYYASQRVDIKKTGQIKEGEDVIGFKQTVRVVKNKVAPPFKEVYYEINYNTGVDTFGGFQESLVFEGILVKSGSWFSYDGTKIANGVAKLRIAFAENPDLVDILTEELKKKRG